NLMFQAYGRYHPAVGGGVFVGGLVAKTTDANGAFYAPNDCAGGTETADVWAYEMTPGPWPATGASACPTSEAPIPGSSNSHPPTAVSDRSRTRSILRFMRACRASRRARCCRQIPTDFEGSRCA